MHLLNNAYYTYPSGVFIGVEESMNAEAVQGVQIQVRDHRALGNCYFF